MLPIYDSVTDGNKTREAIRCDTGLSEGIFDQAFQGLQLLRLIGRVDEEFYPADLQWSTGNLGLDFRMTALHNLAKECSPDDWGKQAVVLLSYQYLMENDIQYFENNDQNLYDGIDRWYRSEKGYDPQSSQGSITLNEPKFVNWSRLAAYLGLIYKANGRQHALYPDERIVMESIRLAADNDQYVDIMGYFNWLQDNLLQIELTNDGRVPGPMARVFYNLVRDNKIRLVERGDAGAVGLSRIPKREGIDTESNTIEVTS
jgi:hypothetical protein